MRKVAKKVCKLSLFSQLSAPIKSGVILLLIISSFPVLDVTDEHNNFLGCSPNYFSLVIRCLFLMKGILHVSSNSYKLRLLLRCYVRVSFHHHASPPGFQFAHIAKGNLAYIYKGREIACTSGRPAFSLTTGITSLDKTSCRSLLIVVFLNFCTLLLNIYARTVLSCVHSSR